ncbi:MAG: 2Fe-2S iron-sulfur cluster-binding protein, partial [Jatrophihabitantaceae bacterium]
GMLAEARAGWPSAVTAPAAGSAAPTDPLVTDPLLPDDEIRERMSGNLCRCGAYVNIVAAISEVATA